MRFRLFYLPLVACLILISVNSAAKSQVSVPYFVRDINDRTSESSFILSFLESDTYSFIFVGTRDGPELWKTDGTPSGTVFLKPLYTNYHLVQKDQPNSGTLDGLLFFDGCDLHPDDLNGNCELWKTDGTPGGTVQFADLNPGGSSSDPKNFTKIGEKLYFLAAGGLWRMDSADSAPVLVIKPTGNNGLTSIDSGLWALGDRLYFSASDTAHGMELWVSDGTPSGTTYLVDLYPGDGSSYPTPLLAYNHSLYFVANSGPSGNEVWEYNQRLGSFHSISSVDAYFYEGLSLLKPMDDRLFFRACQNWDLCSMYVTDGYTSHPLFDQHPEQAPTDPVPLGAIQTLAGERFLFFGQDANGVYDLWFTDGTEAGTSILYNSQLPIPRGNWSLDHNWPDAAFYQGRLFFSMNTPGSGTELWQTDGSPLGTLLVKDIRPGLSGSHPRFLGRCGERMCFSADDGDHGEEVWSTDGSTENTNLLDDFTTTTASSNPGDFTGMGDWVYFVANDGASGPGLWRTDGTPENTNLVWSNPVSPETAPMSLTVAGSQLFFTSDDLTHGNELWVSNGTPGGAFLVQDIVPGMKGSSPRYLTPSGMYLFFIADDGVHGPQVWKTDGTSSGTLMLTDLTPSPDADEAWALMELDGNIIFFVNNYAADLPHIDLWITNGTIEETRPYAELPSTPRYFAKANGKWFFYVYSPSARMDLPWQTDGTLEGTRPISPPACLGDFASISTPFTVGNYTFWMDRNWNLQRQTILKTSGDAFTCVFSFLMVNGDPVIYQPMFDFNGKGIFPVFEGQTAFRLWITDGTTQGTHQLPGNPDYTTDLSSAGPFLYFGQFTPQTGDELWVWDGSDTPPYLVADILPGAESSYPNNFYTWNGKLFFSGSDGLMNGAGHGLELWAYDIPMELFYLPIVFN